MPPAAPKRTVSNKKPVLTAEAAAKTSRKDLLEIEGVPLNNAVIDLADIQKQISSHNASQKRKRDAQSELLEKSLAKSDGHTNGEVERPGKKAKLSGRRPPPPTAAVNLPTEAELRREWRARTPGLTEDENEAALKRDLRKGPLGALVGKQKEGRAAALKRRSIAASRTPPVTPPEEIESEIPTKPKAKRKTLAKTVNDVPAEVSETAAKAAPKKAPRAKKAVEPKPTQSANVEGEKSAAAKKPVAGPSQAVKPSKRAKAKTVEKAVDPNTPAESTSAVLPVQAIPAIQRSGAISVPPTVISTKVTEQPINDQIPISTAAMKLNENQRNAPVSRPNVVQWAAATADAEMRPPSSRRKQRRRRINGQSSVTGSSIDTNSVRQLSPARDEDEPMDHANNGRLLPPTFTERRLLSPLIEQEVQQPSAPLAETSTRPSAETVPPIPAKIQQPLFRSSSPPSSQIPAPARDPQPTDMLIDAPFVPTFNFPQSIDWQSRLQTPDGRATFERLLGLSNEIVRLCVSYHQEQRRLFGSRGPTEQASISGQQLVVRSPRPLDRTPSPLLDLPVPPTPHSPVVPESIVADEELPLVKMDIPIEEPRAPSPQPAVEQLPAAEPTPIAVETANKTSQRKSVSKSPAQPTARVLRSSTQPTVAAPTSPVQSIARASKSPVQAKSRTTPPSPAKSPKGKSRAVSPKPTINPFQPSSDDEASPSSEDIEVKPPLAISYGPTPKETSPFRMPNKRSRALAADLPSHTPTEESQSSDSDSESGESDKSLELNKSSPDIQPKVKRRSNLLRPRSPSSSVGSQDEEEVTASDEEEVREKIRPYAPTPARSRSHSPGHSPSSSIASMPENDDNASDQSSEDEEMVDAVSFSDAVPLLDPAHSSKSADSTVSPLFSHGSAESQTSVPPNQSEDGDSQKTPIAPSKATAVEADSQLDELASQLPPLAAGLIPQQLTPRSSIIRSPSSEDSNAVVESLMSQQPPLPNGATSQVADSQIEIPASAPLPAQKKASTPKLPQSQPAPTRRNLRSAGPAEPAALPLPRLTANALSRLPPIASPESSQTSNNKKSGNNTAASQNTRPQTTPIQGLTRTGMHSLQDLLNSKRGSMKQRKIVREIEAVEAAASRRQSQASVPKRQPRVSDSEDSESTDSDSDDGGKRKRRATLPNKKRSLADLF